MEQLHNGFTLELSEGAFPLSTDSVALAGFTKFPRNATVLDLGSGCGTLGVLLCAKYPDCRVTGLEIHQQAHLTALHNAKANQIDDRLFSIWADLKNIPPEIQRGSYSCCISNPPYFSGGFQSQSLANARHDDLCSMDDLMQAAAYALKYGGDLYLVHRPERLAQLFASACRHGLEPKRLQLLRHRADSAVSLVLVQCRKGGKPGLLWEEESLFLPDGQPTAYYKKIYHL